MSEEVKWNRGHWNSGQLMYETPWVNNQRHGIEKWWNRDGKLWSIEKFHRGQRVININFYPIAADAMMELDLITNELSYD